jgi:ABC-type sulfate transport system permease subunit
MLLYASYTYTLSPSAAIAISKCMYLHLSRYIRGLTFTLPIFVELRYAEGRIFIDTAMRRHADLSSLLSVFLLRLRGVVSVLLS